MLVKALLGSEGWTQSFPIGCGIQSRTETQSEDLWVKKWVWPFRLAVKVFGALRLNRTVGIVRREGHQGQSGTGNGGTADSLRGYPGVGSGGLPAP